MCVKLSGKTEGMRNRNWTQSHAAEMSTRFCILVGDKDKLLVDQQRSSGDRTRPQVHAAVTALKKIANNAIAKAESAAAVESSKQTTRGLGVPQHGGQVQGAKPCDPTRADQEPCLCCTHHMCMETNTIKEIASVNAEAKSKQDEGVLKAWSQEKIGPKPRLVGATSMKIWCCCVKMQCFC
jgi:hypothetical protein